MPAHNGQAGPNPDMTGFGRLCPSIIAVMSETLKGARLDSWKAIANYLGKSVRTARRWEAEEGLPVHRHMHKSQGSVYAYAAEIDAWRERATRGEGPSQAAARAAAVPENTSPLKRSVAVMPFVYLGPDTQSAYIADGFTEEIITGLSRVGPLRVISWTSSMTLRGGGKSASEIGRELGVEQLVEGTVRHEGTQLRVAARLVDATTDDRIWSHSFEGRLDDLFDIQESLARDVVRSLDVDLPAGGNERITSRPSEGIEAWQYLVRARQAALRWRKDSIDEAVRLLEKGLAESGGDARLYAALGRAWLHYREAGIDLGETPLREAESCLVKAARLQPELAASHQLEGWIHYARGDIQAAVHALKIAESAEPGDPDTMALLANCYLISGRVADARPLIDRIVSIDPLTPLTRCMPGWADALDGNFASAVGPYRSMFETDPENPMARLFYVYVLASAGETEEASRVALALPEAMQASPPGEVISMFASALANDTPLESPSAVTQAAARSTDTFPRFMAQAFALAGETDNAIYWVNVAVERGFINYPFLARHDPFLSSLAGNSAYDALLEVVRDRWEAFRP